MESFQLLLDAVSMNNTLTATENNITLGQNQLIQLVNSNGQLKARLTNVLGENTVNQMLSNT